MACLWCSYEFKVPEGEERDHSCPRCGYGRDKVIERPEQLKKIDVDEICKVCQMYLDDIEDGDLEASKQYIFEATMEAVFGDKVFDYINSKLRR